MITSVALRPHHHLSPSMAVDMANLPKVSRPMVHPPVLLRVSTVASPVMPPRVVNMPLLPDPLPDRPIKGRVAMVSPSNHMDLGTHMAVRASHATKSGVLTSLNLTSWHELRMFCFACERWLGISLLHISRYPGSFP